MNRDTTDRLIRDINTKSSAEVAVKMTTYEWTVLLSVLDRGLSIVNRDNSNMVILFEKIASILAGHPVHMVHRDNPDPEYRPEEPVCEPTVSPTAPKKSWFRNLF